MRRVNKLTAVFALLAMLISVPACQTTTANYCAGTFIITAVPTDDIETQRQILTHNETRVELCP